MKYLNHILSSKKEGKNVQRPLLNGVQGIAFFGLLLVLLLMGSGQSFAQQTGCFDLPYLQFENPTRISGSAGQVDTEYRFNNVTSGVDAIVTIVDRQNANLTTIDQNNQGGTTAAFQPQIGAANANLNEGFYEFRIQFVLSGTRTPTTLDQFAVTALDVDGDNRTTREFVGFKAGESYTIEGSTNLDPSYDSPFNIFEASTSAQINGIDPDDTGNLVYLRYGENTSFQFRAGVKNPRNRNGRLFSFDFNSCIRNNFNNAQTTTVDADVSVNKTVDNNRPEIAETINFTINAANNGPRTATGIQITDQLPSGLSFVSSTATRGSYDESTGIWTVGDLNSAGTARLTIEATVNTGTGGTTISNTASISRLNQTDPNTANNADDAVIDVQDSTPAPEGMQACTELTGTWNGSGNTWTSTTASGVGVTVTFQAESGGEWRNTTNGTMNTIDAWSEADVQGANSLQTVFSWDTSPESGSPASDDGVQGTLTLAFDRPVSNPVLHIDRLGGTNGVEPNTAEWRPVTSGASITRLAGPDHFVTRVPRFFRSLTGNSSGTQSSLNTNNGTAAGSVLFKGEFSEIAFELSGLGREGTGGDGIEMVMCGHSRDFGDLPAPFATTLADNGPSHQITGAMATHYLGTAPDAEDDGQPNSNADGDNINGTDDENGISIPDLTKNGSYTITADVTGDGGYLQGWIDWNGDGDFNDSVDGISERVATDLQDGDTDGTIEIPVDVPASATTDQTYARFRWSTVQGLDQTTHARDGEVEDYSTTISEVSISGTVFEDITGNALSDADNDLGDASGDQQALENVQVALYQDDGDGAPNGADAFVQSTTTDASGAYRFAVSNGTYWVAVNSRSGDLLNGGWAEQTYSGTGGRCSDGAGGITLKIGEGPCFGGRRGGVSDNLSLNPDQDNIANAEHIIFVSVSGNNIEERNVGFSYNVVTTHRDGDDDANSGNRSIQGSLRQFIQNANAISGENAMRFVPAVALNQASWWRVEITTNLPAVTGDQTTIDGTAYDLADGVTVRNTNSASVGSGGTVGVDGLTLNRFERKELELNLRDRGGNAFRINSTGTVTVRDIAAYNNSNLLRVSNVSNGVIANNFWGARADGTDPGGSLRGGTAINFNGTASITATISGSYIAYTSSSGVGSGNTNVNAEINTSEIFRTSLTSNSADGIDVTGTWTIEQSLFHENGNANSQPERGGAGIEIGRPSGTAPNSVMRNNTIHSNTVSGINLLNQVNDNLIEKNIIYNNGTNYQGNQSSLGAGIKITSPDGENDVQGNRITQNSIYENFGLGIDLVGTYGGTDSGRADGVTLNDTDDADTGPNGLFNFPIIEQAELSGDLLTITGFARPGTIIEVFDTGDVQDPSGFGEGETYLFTVTEGSSQDEDSTTGSYSGQINGKNQGSNITERFSFTVNVGEALRIGDVITATGTSTNNNTSEFSGNAEVQQSGVYISGTVFSDANHNGTQESGEVGIEDVTVVLYDMDAETCRSLQTGTEGAYVFEAVQNGAYQIIEAAGEATPSPGSCPPTEADPAGHVSTTSNTLGISITGAPSTENNFGDFNGSRLAGTVFRDDGLDGGTANDGSQNGGEKGIAGATLKLTNSDGSTALSTVKSAGDGSYTFWIPDAQSGNLLRIAETNLDNYVSTGGDAGSTGGSYSRANDAVTFTAESGNEYSGIDFGDVRPNVFLTNGEQNTTAGSVVFFPHTFKAQTTGELSFNTTNKANPENSGWSQVVYRDNNCNGKIDDGEQQITEPLGITRGQKVCIVVRAGTPSGAPEGATNTITVQANFAYTNATPALSRSYSRTDRVNITDASGSGLKITKQVDRAEALPGEMLTYTITYTNNGSESLNSLEIDDSTPSYTSFASASCDTPLPDNLSNCTISDPGPGNTGPITWTFDGTLAPGKTGTVTYRVTIDE